MSGMFLFNVLLASLEGAGAAPLSSIPPDSMRPPVVPPAELKDSAARAMPGKGSLPGSLGKDSASARRDTLPARSWTLRVGGSAGLQFPSFPQRSRFRTDIAKVAARDTLTLQQELQSSELSPLLGLELSLQWREAVRLVAEGQWSAWWNDAQAARGDTVRNWDLTVQVWRAGLGPDLIVPTRVFSIQGMGPLVIESRAWLVKSSLEARGYSEGWGNGWSVGLASSLHASRRYELGGRVRWHQESVRGRGDWGQLLETGGSGRPRWATGGLALGLWSTFDAGW